MLGVPRPPPLLPPLVAAPLSFVILPLECWRDGVVLSPKRLLPALLCSESFSAEPKGELRGKVPHGDGDAGVSVPEEDAVPGLANRTADITPRITEAVPVLQFIAGPPVCLLPTLPVGSAALPSMSTPPLPLLLPTPPPSAASSFWPADRVRLNDPPLPSNANESPNVSPFGMAPSVDSGRLLVVLILAELPLALPMLAELPLALPMISTPLLVEPLAVRVGA